jgi:hypothetical protein
MKVPTDVSVVFGLLMAFSLLIMLITCSVCAGCLGYQIVLIFLAK